MKTLIIYHSEHHGNTKKLLDAIAGQGDVTLLDASHVTGSELSEYDIIGFASGIYYQKFHEDVLKCAEQYLPQGKQVFFLFTCGVKRSSYTDAIQKISEAKGAHTIGSYNCLGFDTFGPFKLIGGIAKGRPNDKDIAGAVAFYQNICQNSEKPI